VRKLRRLIRGVVGVVVGGSGLLSLGAMVPAQVTLAATKPQIIVQEGVDTLHAAVAQANPGDTLVLQPGLYELTHTVLIDKDLSIRGATQHREDVHIVGTEEFDLQEALFPNPLDWGHLLFVTNGASRVSFSYFTIKGAPEVEAIDEFTCEGVFQLNHSECMGDAIHTDGVSSVEVEHVEASLNAGNGIWVDGAVRAWFKDILAVNNGAFGIDVDTALVLTVRQSQFIANQVSGIEASGHVLGTPRDQYVARVSIRDVLAKGNGEIGIEVERFALAKVEDATCADNREDGFDADRVGEVAIKQSSFINNMDDAIELFPVNVVAAEQPADFPGSIVEVFSRLTFSGNVGDEINHAPTEN